MRTPARVLLVDDDRVFNDTLAERLRERGHSVRSAYAIQTALDLLDVDSFDVAILDLKLDGPEGADVGVDSIGKILDRAPTIKPIVITAYADSDSVERAFKCGAYDYVEKTDFRVFEALLLAKIGNALEPAREARFAALGNGAREAQLAAQWAKVLSEPDRARKGALLEELMVVLWRSIPGFERTVANRQSQDEEIDLVVVNEAKDEFWKKESQIFLIECKNWISKVDPKEIDRFGDKIKRRHGRCRLGFFVAPEGFTPGVATTLSANRKDKSVIVLLAKPELESLIAAGSPGARSEGLKELVLRALVQG